jgi:steroid 5-alpha reductase family enzyme
MLLVERIVILGADSVTPIQIVVFVLICIWGIRLASLILRRYHGPDERYVELEKFDSRCPAPLKAVSICIKIFGFQAAISVLITDCAIKIFYFSKPEDSFGAFEIAGIILWCIGFFFEVVGDQQLTNFVNSPNKVPGQVIDTGLWRYTRHPNYFGESLLWYAYYLMACGGSTGPAGGYYTFYSPLVMHFMLRYFSGVLILEAKQKRKPAFRVYMLETNCFVPWFYKKIEGDEREKLLVKFKQEIDEEL